METETNAYTDSLAKADFSAVAKLCDENAPNPGAATNLKTYLKKIENHYPLIAELEALDYKALLNGTKLQKRVDSWRSKLISHFNALKRVKTVRNGSIGNGTFFEETPELRRQLEEIIDVCKLIAKNEADFSKAETTQNDLLQQEKKQAAESLELKVTEIQNLILKLEAEKSVTKKKNEEISELKSALAKKETAKLAIAFETQKDDYARARRFWLDATILSFLLLFLAVLGSILIYSGIWQFFGKQFTNLAWYDKIGIYLLDVVLMSLTYFSASQYSKNDDRYDEFANKQAIAQSFKNLYDTIDIKSRSPEIKKENELIKNKFLDRASSVLFSESKSLGTTKKSNLPIEEVIKLLNSAIKR